MTDPSSNALGRTNPPGVAETGRSRLEAPGGADSTVRVGSTGPAQADSLLGSSAKARAFARTPKTIGFLVQCRTLGQIVELD